MMTDPYGQTNPRPVNAATAPIQLPPVGALSPRMLLAMAAIYNPAILIGYLLYLYGPSNGCVLGGLCNFGDFPGIIQVFLLFVGAFTLGAVTFVPLWWLLDEGRPARDIVSRTARDMARFVTIRPLMLGYSLLLFLLLIIGIVMHRVPAPLFLLGAMSTAICLWCAAGREYIVIPATPPPPQQPQYQPPLQYQPQYQYQPQPQYQPPQPQYQPQPESQPQFQQPPPQEYQPPPEPPPSREDNSSAFLLDSPPQPPQEA